MRHGHRATPFEGCTSTVANHTAAAKRAVGRKHVSRTSPWRYVCVFVRNGHYRDRDCTRIGALARARRLAAARQGRRNLDGASHDCPRARLGLNEQICGAANRIGETTGREPRSGVMLAPTCFGGLAHGLLRSYTPARAPVTPPERSLCTA